MDKIRIIEKAKGMEKEGAINLLKYHQELQQSKIRRLGRQKENAQKIHEAIGKEIERREKEEEFDALQRGFDR